MIVAHVCVCVVACVIASDSVREKNVPIFVLANGSVHGGSRLFSPILGTYALVGG